MILTINELIERTIYNQLMIVDTLQKRMLESDIDEANLYYLDNPIRNIALLIDIKRQFNEDSA